MSAPTLRPTGWSSIVVGILCATAVVGTSLVALRPSDNADHYAVELSEPSSDHGAPSSAEATAQAAGTPVAPQGTQAGQADEPDPPTPDQPEPGPQEPDPPAPVGPQEESGGADQPCIEMALVDCLPPFELAPFHVNDDDRDAAGGDSLSAGAGVVAGCAVDCLVSATVDPHRNGTSLHVTAETDTLATIRVWVVDHEVQVLSDGGPQLRNGDAVLWTVGDLDLFLDGEVDGLVAGKTYWIAVSASDEHGGRSWAQGAVTMPDPVRTPPPAPEPAPHVAMIALDLYISYDGDHGINRGDLTFDVWIEGPLHLDTFSGKWGDGTRFDLSDDNIGYQDSELDDDLAWLRFTAMENDNAGLGVGCAAAGYNDTPVSGAGHTDGSCDISYQHLLIPGLTAEGVAQLARCSTFGVEGNFAEWLCTRWKTLESGSGVPEFSVLMAYKVIED